MRKLYHWSKDFLTGSSHSLLDCNPISEPKVMAIVSIIPLESRLVKLSYMLWSIHYFGSF